MLENGQFVEYRFNAAFSTCFTQDDLGELVSVYGERNYLFMLGGIRIPALKYFVMGDASSYFGYGIGDMGSGEDPQPDGADLLTYVRVGGKEYGTPLSERFIILGTPPEPEIPGEVTLTSRPNPFSREAMFTVTLAEPARVTLRIVDVLGRTVAVLFDEQPLPPGVTSVVWRAQSAPGVYVALLTAGDGTRRSLKVTRTN